MKTILFVCSGNICRSPMAEALMNDRLPSTSAWRAASAGTSAIEGIPASPEAVAALAELGIDMTGHRSRRLTPARIEQATLIVAMTSHHRDIVLGLAPGATPRTCLLGDFDPDRRQQDIGDPIGGSLQVYRRCRNLIRSCLPGLLACMRDIDNDS